MQQCCSEERVEVQYLSQWKSSHMVRSMLCEGVCFFACQDLLNLQDIERIKHKSWELKYYLQLKLWDSTKSQFSYHALVKLSFLCKVVHRKKWHNVFLFKWEHFKRKKYTASTHFCLLAFSKDCADASTWQLCTHFNWVNSVYHFVSVNFMYNPDSKKSWNTV